MVLVCVIVASSGVKLTIKSQHFSIYGKMLIFQQFFNMEILRQWLCLVNLGFSYSAAVVWF